MTRQNTFVPDQIPESLDAFLDALSIVAVGVLNEHGVAGDRCTACRTPWPCEAAATADHNLQAAEL